MQSSNRAALEGARAEIRSIAAEFTRAAEPIVKEALERRLDDLLGRQRDRVGTLKPPAVEALRAAATAAIAAGAADSVARLADPDRWLSPLTAPGVFGRREEGWDGSFPGWVHTILRRLTRKEQPSLGELDDPANRIWLALVAAAKPLDPVLREFGLEPSSTPGIGGGRFGVQPRTASQLDPSGVLVRLWKRYRHAYERYAALLGPST